MTTSPHSIFKHHWAIYQNARSRFERLSGDDLISAQDDEAQALAALCATPATTPKEVRLKATALSAQQAFCSGFADGREQLLVASTTRDIARLEQ